MKFLAQHNYPVPLFLEQDTAFCDDAVPLIVHMYALSLSTGAFRRAHHIYFTVTHFHPFPFPYIRKYHRPSGFAIGNPGQRRVPQPVYEYKLLTSPFCLTTHTPATASLVTNFLLTFLFAANLIFAVTLVMGHKILIRSL